MASIAPLPPTPQQSFSYIAPQASPPQQQTPNGLSSSYGHSYNMSFDSLHTSQSTPNYSQSFPNSQSYPNGPAGNAAFSRSFGDGYAVPRGYEGKPQIYTVCNVWRKLRRKTGES